MELAVVICVIAITRATHDIANKLIELKKIEATEKKWFDD